jgi:histone-lysine N-methyltransferase SETMAR
VQAKVDAAAASNLLRQLECKTVGKTMAEWQPPNLTVEGLGRAEHPPYSPDLSPCDFWLFGFLKEKLKDLQLRGVQSFHQAIPDLWNELTFEDVHAVFLEWMNRLSWVRENKGEYFIA